MTIDVATAVGAPPRVFESSWRRDDVILYHLGIGAGLGDGKAADPAELTYTYEGALKVLPSFAVIPPFQAIADMGRYPGVAIDLSKVLHGEQELVVHRPLPTAATVTNSARVAAVYDKGKAALVVFEVDTATADGEALFTNRFSIFARGEGGFGGDPGPKAETTRPDREPDLVVESPTMAHQALIYRLSGDKNPLHADPEFARLGGFDTPILHGLCSFGIVCKAVVDHALRGDVTRVAGYRTRFAGVVFPGETIVTSMWWDDGRVLVEATCKERGAPVLSNAVITLR